MLADASLVAPWMNELLSSPAAVRLGWVCVHTLWQGAAVAAALAMALRLIPRRSPAALEARYILAATALAALPLAAVATFLLVPATRPAAAVVSSRGGGDGTAPTPTLARAGEAAPGDAGLALAPVPTMPAPAAVVHAPLMLERDQLARLAAWLPLVALAWTVGAVLAAARMACGWWVTRRLVARAAAIADGRLQGRVDHWRRTMRIDAAVRILSSAAVEAPVVIGWLKPVILWPAAALVGMPAHELDAIVAHELAHVRRRDALLNLLQACIDVLFFHHPAAWWISAQVRAEREHCADDLAVRALEAGRAGTRLSYARALLALEERRHTAALAVAANGGSLLDRIRRLAGADAEPAGPGRLLAAGLTAAAVVAIALSVAAPRQATAAELPEDTNKIESLTPEQARRLAKEFPGVDVEIETKGFDKTKVSGCLPLNGLKSLDAETTKALAEFKGQVVSLNGLRTLDADTAKALAEFKGNWLTLDGLTTLDTATAKALVEFKGGVLSLSGLTTLDADTAKALAELKGQSLNLSGLTTLDVDTAKALAEFKGKYLHLNGLTTLDADTAKALAEYKGDSLYLDGLTTLDAGTAKALAEFKGVDLFLNGLTTIDTATAKALAEFKGQFLYLDGLTTLDADTAKALAEVKGEGLTLSGLTTIDTATAKALAEFKGEGLTLDGLTTIDTATAKALAEFKGDWLTLDGLTTIDTATAKALAEFKGKYLHLNGLTTLDADTAKVIAGSKAWNGQLRNLTTLDADTAKALADFKGHLYLDGLTTLDTDTAKALAEFMGIGLHLRGLTTLDAETAKALAESRGEGLFLSGLTTLDTDTAKALAEFDGDLFLSDEVFKAFSAKNPLTPETALAWAVVSTGDLSSVTALDAETAKSLAEFKGQSLNLFILTTLDAETAKELAEFKGKYLYLSGLTTLDAETAKALAEFKGERLALSRLTTLDADTAKSLAATPKWDGQLPNLTTLDTPESIAVAQALATRKGPLALPNLKKISPKTLSALIEKEDVEIPLIETLELIPEPDGSANDDFVIPEWLEERDKKRR